MGLLQNLKHTITVFFGRNNDSFLIKKIASATKKIHLATENLNFDVDTNGEARLVEILAMHNPKMIFDVGANVGHYANFLKREMPQATIHAFEPIKSTYELFKKNTRDHQSIVLNNSGLGKEKGVLEFTHFPNAHWLTSALPLEDIKEKSEKVSVQLIKGDDYCKEHNISKIDYLKIDVEGFELDVIKGFENMFNQKNIGLVQFEYGHLNLDTAFLLRHFYEFFKDKGYSLGKIHPTRVEFENYSREKENFIGPNYAIINDDLVELKKDLQFKKLKPKGQRSYFSMLLKRTH